MDRDDSMFDEDHGPRTGANAMGWYGKKNPREVLVELIEDEPDADSRRLLRKWWPIIKADDDLLEAAGTHAFYNLLKGIRQKHRDNKSKSKDAKIIERARIDFYKNIIKGNILMDITLPNGKKLRDATFAECSAAGGWFKSLAVKGKPSEIVGKTLTEQDLQKHRAGK